VIKKTIPLAIFSSLLKPGYEAFDSNLVDLRATVVTEIAFTSALYAFQVTISLNL
jgi:hypothetical protein